MVSGTTEEKGSGSFGEDLWCLEKEGCLMKKVLVLSRERDGGKRPVRFLELLMEKMVAL